MDKHYTPDSAGPDHATERTDGVSPTPSSRACFGQGQAIAPALAALLELAPREQSGAASAVVSSARRLERPRASPCLARC
ncbi:hypothetical protein ACH49_17230 [Streptomyces leeuwenhoekii]|uniref:Uncharacterized protein n=1 Tax=Streptomyces leeuwenhoekii TaxID=1437453 RepID=A0ABR5HWZ9_STRLW|nr:hypothetical protein ACH49_17230 [Streptomyces leeuwenhoekii]